jgi:hypothetical protein
MGSFRTDIGILCNAIKRFWNGDMNDYFVNKVWRNIVIVIPIIKLLWNRNWRMGDKKHAVVEMFNIDLK